MAVAVGIWLHGEPLGLALIEGDNLHGAEFEDHEYADLQTWRLIQDVTCTTE